MIGDFLTYRFAKLFKFFFIYFRWKTFHKKLTAIQDLARKAVGLSFVNSSLVEPYSASLNLDLTNKGLTSRIHLILAMAKTGLPNRQNLKVTFKFKNTSME